MCLTVVRLHSEIWAFLEQLSSNFSIFHFFVITFWVLIIDQVNIDLNSGSVRIQRQHFLLIVINFHCNDITSASLRLKSSIYRLSVQQLFRLTAKYWIPALRGVLKNNLSVIREMIMRKLFPCHDAIMQWRICMMTSSNGNIFGVTGPLCGESPVTGEFPSQRPVTRSFDVFFGLRLE